MKNVINITLVVAAFLNFSALATRATAEIHRVPTEFQSVQDAVNSSLDGDTVLIDRGRYSGSVVVPDISVTVCSPFIFTHDMIDIAQTTLVPSGNSLHFLATTGSEHSQLRLVGLRLVGTSQFGGGLQGAGQNISVEYCHFDSCTGGAGRLIHLTGAAITVSHSEFGNRLGPLGNLFELNHSSLTLDECRILGLGSFSSLFSLDSTMLEMTRTEIIGCGSISFGVVFDLMEKTRINLNECVISGNSLASLTNLDQQGQQIEFICKNSFLDSNSVAFNLLDLNGWADSSYIEFRDNTIRYTSVIDGYGGLHMLALATQATIRGEVTGNLFYRNHRRQTSGVFIDDFGSFSASRNYFIDNTSEGFLSPPGGPVMLIGNNPGSFHENILMGNQGNAVDHFSFTRPGYAEFNYWGHPSGPYHRTLNPTALGDTVDTLIFFDPWQLDTLFLTTPESNLLPVTFSLGLPFPNPFNSSVTIEYVLVRDQQVALEVYDVLGRLVKSLSKDRLSMGKHSVTWDADGFPTGLYFVRLSNNAGESQTAKLMLMK